MGSETVLASTPIVRITAQQLEYLTSRLRDKGGLSTEAKKRWTPNAPLAVGVSNVNPNRALPYNERRRALVMSAGSQNVSLAFGQQPLLQNGFVQLATQSVLILTFDQLGAGIWQQLWCSAAAAGGTLNIQEFQAVDVDI